MRFFGRKKKDKHDAKEIVPPSFIIGVEDTFQLKDSEDLVVVGDVKGTIHKGDAVYIVNPGVDKVEKFESTIDGIEVGPQKTVSEAMDCHVGLVIHNGCKYNIRKASVLYAGEQSAKNIHDIYINALGDTYVANKQLELTDQELEELTITDCTEIWRLFAYYHTKVVQGETEEEIQKNRKKLDRLADALCKKIMQAEEIYCIFSKKTGEPHMFSRTVDQGDGSYMCTPPDIRIITKAYEPVMKEVWPEEQFEIRKIENGDKKDGIYNFLGSTFYLNGACGVEVLSEETAINANMLVELPDLSNVPVQDIPVTNPDLMRWMLLIGQLGKTESENEKLIYSLYYGFMSKELIKAKFLIPMQKDGEIEPADEDGKVILKEDTTIKFPTMEGKYGRSAVRMFTDWKRLRMVYDDEWNGMVQQIDGMIDVLDCAINATQYPEAGCYIGKEMYEDMKNSAPA